MRRDLPLDVDPAELVSAPPDRSALKEIFRRFEFRGLLGRVDTLDEALPAAAPSVETEAVAWHEGAPEELVLNQHKGLVGIAAADGRAAAATGDEVVVFESSLGELARAAGASELATHDAKSSPAAARPGRRHPARRVPDRPGARRLRARRPRARARARARAGARGRGGDGGAGPPCGGAAAARPGASRAAARVGSERLYDEIELPLTVVLADMELAGVRIDTYRMGEITAGSPTGSRSSRRRRSSSPASSSSSARRSSSPGSCSRSSG